MEQQHQRNTEATGTLQERKLRKLKDPQGMEIKPGFYFTRTDPSLGIPLKVPSVGIVLKVYPTFEGDIDPGCLTAVTMHAIREYEGSACIGYSFNDLTISTFSPSSIYILDMPFPRSPLPGCGHSSQYAYTSDGGAHILCLLCEYGKHER